MSQNELKDNINALVPGGDGSFLLGESDHYAGKTGGICK